MQKTRPTEIENTDLPMEKDKSLEVEQIQKTNERKTIDNELGDEQLSQRDNEWIKNINTYAKALDTRYITSIRKLKTDDFYLKVNELKKNIPNLSDKEIVFELMKITASFKDAHSSVQWETTNHYPIRFYEFTGNIYVINTIPEYESALYCRLVRVNNYDIEYVKNQLRDYISIDNEYYFKTFIADHLKWGDILQIIGVNNQIESVIYTLVDENGYTFDVNVSLGDQSIEPDFILKYDDDKVTPLYLKNRDKNYWYEHVPENKLLYIGYNRTFYDQKPEYDAFREEICEIMDSQPLEKIVVDLRYNGGGYTRVYEPLKNDIVGRDHINQKGKLFCVIGRDTFSAAMHLAEDFKDESNATLIGEPTGTHPNGFSSTTSFSLFNDYAKLYVYLSGTSIEWETHPNVDTVYPDIYIDQTITSYRNKGDTIMEYILQN